MSSETLQRRRMSYEEWWDLPPHPKAEWVDGEVVVSPHAGYAHQAAANRLVQAILRDLPALFCATEVPISLPNNRVRIPDVVAFANQPREPWVTAERPVLVAEVLSPSTRREDTMRKAPEYAAAGIGQYWIVDPEAWSIDVYELENGGWSLRASVDPHRPRAEIAVGGFGTVSLRMTDVLGEA